MQILTKAWGHLRAIQAIPDPQSHTLLVDKLFNLAGTRLTIELKMKCEAPGFGGYLWTASLLPMRK